MALECAILHARCRGSVQVSSRRVFDIRLSEGQNERVCYRVKLEVEWNAGAVYRRLIRDELIHQK